MKRNILYYSTSFVAGYVMLSLELLGFRLFAPYFGYSLYVSGALIGVILLALSLGYSLGGYLGDTKIGKYFVPKTLLYSGFYLLFIWLLHSPLLATFSAYSIITGSLLATFIFFAPPMIFLASLSPYLIKLISLEKDRGVSFSAGSIYTVGTIGSLFGTFLTSFFIVPEFGVSAAFVTNIVLLLCASIFWFTKKTVKRIAALIVILASSPYFGDNSLYSSKVLAQTDSIYGHLEVVDEGTSLGLRTDHRNNLVYSLYPKDGKWQGNFSLYHLFAVPPILNNATTSLLLGLGAGTLPYIHQEFNPDLSIIGVEIDPKIPELGDQYFGLKDRTNTKVVIDDVRPFLMKDENKYGFIEMDLFWGSGEIPFYLATKEFFTLTHEHLLPHGILAINVYDPSENGAIIRPLANTVASVYSHVYYVPYTNGSYFVFGMDDELNTNSLDSWTEKNSDTADKRFLYIIKVFKNNLTSVPFDQTTLVFTDDKAPLEKLSYEAIFH